MELFLLLLLLASPLSATPAASVVAYPTIPGTTDTSASATQDDSKLIPIRREVYGDGRIIEITHWYTSEVPFFGTNGIGEFLRPVWSMKNGPIANLSELKLFTHMGTHVDAPGHVYDNYFDAGFDADTLES